MNFKNLTKSATVAWALFSSVATTQAIPELEEREKYGVNRFEELAEHYESQNVCQSQQLIDKVGSEVFILVQWPETKQNKLTACYYGDKIFEAPIATWKPQHDGGVYTPEWVFPMWNLDKNKVSKTYKASWLPAQMPYAVQVYKWVWIHQGRVHNKVWKILNYPSHGCVRLEKWKAEEFFDLARDLRDEMGEVKIIVEWTNPRTKNPWEKY